MREGRRAVAFGVPGAEGAGRWRERLRVGEFFSDNISVDVQWKEDGSRCKGLTAFLADAHFQAMGEKGEREEPLELREKMTG